jgi:uncharacterized RDD family membrane protein YckC
MSAQWFNARIQNRRGRQYRLTLEDAPSDAGWITIEAHSVCLDTSADRAVLESQLARLCEPPVSYDRAKNLLADLRGNVLDRPVARAGGGYASIGTRVVARFLDALIFAALFLIAPLWFDVRLSGKRDLAIFWVVAVVFFFVYRVGMHAWSGQTIGKKVCEIAVRDLSGGPLRFWQALLREIVDILFFAVSAVFAVLLFDIMPLLRGGGSFEAVLPLVMFLSPLGWLSEIWLAADALAMFTNEKHRALHDFIGRSVVVRTGG